MNKLKTVVTVKTGSSLTTYENVIDITLFPDIDGTTSFTVTTTTDEDEYIDIEGTELTIKFIKA
jgi:hypothetical protein